VTFDLPESDLEALLDHSADILTIVDRTGTLQYSTRSIERILGYDPDLLVGENVFERVHPDDRRAVVGAFADPSVDAVTDPVEFRFRHADGTWTWLAAVGSTQPDSDLGGYLLDLRDVTEGKRIDRERTAIFNRMTDAFYALDAEWRFTYLNDRAAELLDSEPDALLGESIWDAFPEAVGTTVHDRFHEAMETQTELSFELHYDPLETLFSVRVYPAEGGLTAYFRDVTDERRVREELEASVDVLHALYELASDPDLTFEEKRKRILRLGAAYLDLPYGFVTTLHDDVQYIVASVGDHGLLQPGNTCDIEDAYCRKTIDSDQLLGVGHAAEEGWAGDAAYERFRLESYVGAKLLVDDDLYGTLCFAGDEPRGAFSDSERAFVELASRWLSYELSTKQYRERLEERNERLEGFTSIVSHDLRNPLNVAQLRLEQARQGEGGDHLDAVADAHDRMESLIDDLLTLARHEKPVEDTAVVDLAALVDECWATVATGSATFDNRANGRIVAEEGRLRRLFENLFRNAVEHGSTGSQSGTVDAAERGATGSQPTVEDAVERGSTGSQPGTDDAVAHGDSDVTISVSTLPDGFAVADDGPGIPADERDRVFEQGYSTAQDGTGFGLTIVQQIAAAHGWTVSVTESETGGARFEFTGVTFAD